MTKFTNSNVSNFDNSKLSSMARSSSNAKASREAFNTLTGFMDSVEQSKTDKVLDHTALGKSASISESKSSKIAHEATAPKTTTLHAGNTTLSFKFHPSFGHAANHEKHHKQPPLSPNTIIKPIHPNHNGPDFDGGLTP